ncbi:Fibronectin type-III domain-containing protein [Aphelenchoides bicaudatus]|nr:Fibronectin type-III domain-containing protein [Aphelenchoides bicaudatus]
MSRHRLWRLSITTPIVILFIISYQVESFQVLPYVNIDYEYYLKLGICQSQCTEKYGTVAYKRRLDGSTRSYFNTTNQHYNMCQLGCQNARSSMPNTRSVVEDAFRDGQQFWLSGAQNIPNKKSTLSSTQNADRSPIASLKILCLRQSSSAQANGFLDSYTALLSAQPHKVDFLAPARYLIQWKQRIPLGKNKDQRFDETKWITASIEPDLSFYAEGVQPGVQYRFMATVIMPSGRMGATVTSDWVEAPSLGAPIPSSPLPLVLTPQFNSDDNVSAVVSFRTRWFCI